MTLRLAEDQPTPRQHERRWEATVHHGGRAFIATAAMAAIFKAHAEDAIARGETELVPLLHRGGVELLLISPDTNFAVVKIELGLTETRPITLPVSRPAS
jgi:hypothetical protein